MVKSKIKTIFKTKKNKPKLWIVAAVLFLGVLMLVSSLTIAYLFYYWGRVYPGVQVAGVSIGGLTIEEAEKKLKEEVDVPDRIILKNQSQEHKIPLNTIDFSYDYNKSATNALYLYKSTSALGDVVNSLITIYIKPNLPLEINYNNEKLKSALSVIAGQVAVEPTYPSVQLINKKVVVEKGKAGQDVDLKSIENKIINNLSYSVSSIVEIKIVEINPALNETETKETEQRAERLIGKTLSSTFEYSQFNYGEVLLISFIEPRGGYSEEKVAIEANKIARNIKREPQNAVFKFTDGRVNEFLPAKEGVEVNEESLKIAIIASLNELETEEEKNKSFEIPTTKSPAKVTTKEVNDLGINELLGRGESWYAGSISSRVHNIGLAASKFNGVLVSPGETFSFNEIVGDVSALTGYKQAYVIQDGKTVLGDGGGVCQVSTTLFRAALYSGLPIVERRPHSYRVTYYEQKSSPGLDATVYSPTTDLKIKNDTPNHILIQTINNPKTAHLVFEIYGTSDGRVATVSKPVVTGVSAPPEDLYTDDPTLPAGTVKQIDWKAWGARVVFNYKVVRNGETHIEKTYVSSYRPWQAKFLRGTSPAI